ncbi:hypothetical protein KW799_02760, partial [Candidatus Parcubacteria bacterium]|nr:hypothetical protein [Candidatus Parcubacteria bacterium]
TAVQNPSDADLKGAVYFYSNDKEIGSADFSIAAGNSEVVWARFTAEAGSQKFSAKIHGSAIDRDDGDTQEIADVATQTIAVVVAEKPDTAEGSGSAIPNIPVVSNAIAAAAGYFSGTSSLVSDLLDRVNVGDETKKEPAYVSFVKNAVARADQALETTQRSLEARAKDMWKTKAGGENPTKSENAAAAGLSVLAFFLKWKTLVYLVGTYVLYKLAKLLIKKLVRRPSID